MVQFGTSGLRGLAEELTDDLCATYAAAFASLHFHDGTLLIGRDLRASSPRITRAVMQGARAAGLQVIDCGVLPTPALALASETRGTMAIMVTGSHIPANRNGLKFYTRDGEITKEDEATLVAAVEAWRPVDLKEEAVPDTDPFAIDLYIERFTAFFGPDALKGQRVGVWQQSSAAREVLPDILARLGADVVRLAASDDFIPIDTEAVDPAMRRKLAGWTGKYGLAALVSTDGDGDRPMMTDASGQVVPGDILGPITARYLGASHIVTPVSANTLVDLMGDFTVDRCRIGSPYVIAGMQDRAGEKVIGYEPNGGVLLGFQVEADGRKLDALMTRDSTLPIVCVLAAAAAKRRKVADLVADLPQRRTATDRLQNVPTDASLKLANELIAGDTTILPGHLGPPFRIDATDGARLTFVDDTIVTVRPSGNAPELRCYVEAKSDEKAQALLAEMLESLRAALS